MDSFFASLMFFTRLPWWRLRSVPKEAFEHVVDWWPLIGWLTGGVMSAVFLAASLLGFAPAVAALLAISARLLLTGALHEDGLADFCDGFGGGSTRERTLFIMKDSHIGTYGVLGLIFGLGLLGASVADVSGRQPPAALRCRGQVRSFFHHRSAALCAYGRGCQESGRICGTFVVGMVVARASLHGRPRLAARAVCVPRDV